MAITESYVRNRLYFISLNELQPDPDQPRKYLDPAALQELTESIRQHGVLQPILFRQDKGGLVYVVAGERRCAAARMAGLVSIPAVYTESANYDELALIENILRSDLTPVEEAEALGRLMKSHAYQQDDLVRIIGKAKTTISETLSLNNLPNEIREECRKDPSIPKNVLVTIARKKQERSMLTAYWQYKDKMNPRKKTRTGGNVSKAQGTFNAMDVTQRKINLLDIPALSPEEKLNFIIALENMKQAIETVLAAAMQPAPAEQKPSKILA
jgi:ParB family chromosome partitioning protein